ncbi:p24 complex component [Basidiobolus ranarum]|uniref:P24 complex component n=1 Tax=Basidiobolus ranarum TaxID=34480 RepID=A0ABR2WPH6_9FUNG
MKFIHLTLLSILYFLATVTGFSIYVQPKSAECFFEELKKDDKITISFEVGGAGHFAVDFQLTDPQGRVLQNLKDRPSGQVNIEVATPGKHVYCFQNEDSNMVENIVLWNIHGLEREQPLPEKENNDGELTLIEVEVAKLTEGVNYIRDQQEYVVLREVDHRNTAESTNSRVKWWYVFQSGVLVAMCAFQIYYVKNFFESKQAI